MTDNIKYDGVMLPSSQKAIPQRVKTIMHGPRNDSMIYRILSRAMDMPDALRVAVVVLFLIISRDSHSLIISRVYVHKDFEL